MVYFPPQSSPTNGAPPETLPSALSEEEARGLLSQRFHQNQQLEPLRDERGRFARDPGEDETPPVQEPPETEDDPSEAPTERPKPAEPAESEADEPADLTSLSQLAEAYEVDVDDVMALTHDIQYGDKRHAVSLKDAYAAYGEREATTRRRTELDTTITTLQQRETQRQQEWQGFHDRMAAQLNDAETYHTAQMSSPQMLALRTEDPEAYIAQMESLRNTVEDIQKKRTEAATRYQHEAALNYQRMVQVEEARLKQLAPDWTEERGKRVMKLTQELKLTPQEQHLVIHNAGLVMALDELGRRRGDTAPARGKLSKKKVARRIPKMASGGTGSGSRGTGQSSEKRNMAALKKKLVESGGDPEIAAQLLTARRKAAKSRK